MKLRLSLLSFLVLVALLVAACGGATATPAAPMDKGSEPAMPADSGAAMPADSSGEMQNDSGTAMPADSSGAMQNDSGAAMPGDSGAMQHDSSAVMPGDSSGAMQGDSGSTVPADNSGAMDSGSSTALPAWFSAELTDVNTGQTFTIAGLQGKVILVETMAIWCPNCLQQQKQVQALHQALGMNVDLVTVTLDVDPNENASSLQAYAAKNSFDWIYAVAPTDVAREIGQLYGDQFLNPTSTPMLIVDSHGLVHPLPFGIKKANALQEALSPFLNGGM
jgi:thiol-disulfide isomerase/thioredoxin